MLEHIKDSFNKLLAIILRNREIACGINFVTPPEFSQQLGLIRRPQGHIITPHRHNAVLRTVHFTQEVLFIKTGKVRVDFYDDSKIYIESRILENGDLVLLASGGHGLLMLEESEIIEVKQGPYAGAIDKELFEPVSDDLVNTWSRKS